MKRQYNIELIKKYMIKYKMNVSEFCKACKISRYSYYKIMNNQDINYIPVLKIADYLHVSLDVLLNRRCFWLKNATSII